MGHALKTCSVCKEQKELNNFYNQLASKDGLYPRCKECDYLAQKKYINKNRERFKKARRAIYLKHKYKITSETFEKLLIEQNFVCYICGKHQNKNLGPGGYGGQQSLAIDHNHITGKIRGLLCNTCNRALGLFNDNANLIERAANYIRKYQTH